MNKTKIAMLKNYLKTSIQNLLKNRLFSLINIAGLTIGLASFGIVMFYVNYELSYDKFFEKADNIYRVYMDYLEGSRYEPGDAQVYNLSGPTIKKEFAEVVDFVRFYRLNKTTFEIENEIFEVKNGQLADPSYFNVFAVPLLKGNTTALAEPNSIVLTQHISNMIFGSADPMGKTLTAYHDGQKTILTVTGILRDIPENTHMRTNFLVSFQTYHTWRVTSPQEPNWNNNNFFTYLLVDENTDIAGLRKKIADMDVPLKDERHNIESIINIHLHSDKPYEAEMNGNSSRVRFLFAVGGIILILSWLNYINLTTAKSSERTKEIGVRKVSGARRNQIVFQFITESLLLNLLAIAIALGILIVSLPYFNSFSGKQLLNGLTWTTSLLWLIGIPLTGILISSLYPAFLLAGFNPSGILRAKFINYPKNSGIRTGLIVTQFMAAIILVISAMTILKQIRFIKNQPLGIDIEQIISIKGEMIDENLDYGNAFETLKGEIQKLPFVSAVASSWTYPGEGYDNLSSFMSITYPNGVQDSKTVWYNYEIDHDYINVLNMDLLTGSPFVKSYELNKNKIIINEEAAKKMGFNNYELVINQKVNFWGQDWIIAGVIKNYHHFGLKNEIEPLMLRYNPIAGGLLVKLNKSVVSIAGVNQAIEELENQWRNIFPKSIFQYNFVDEKFAAQYAEDAKFSKIFSFFTFLAIFIASLGLFGLTYYRCMVRTKEIGVRKVNGAKVSEILTMLNKDFVKWVVIAFFIATPISWFAMNKWLENFAYKTELSWWIFALAGVLALGIALLTVSWQSWKAATRNPVEALRYE